MVLETGSRIGQDTLSFPDFQREKLERALMQTIGGDYEEIAYQRLRQLRLLGQDERIELKPTFDTSRDKKVINLHNGVLGSGIASIDFIPSNSTIRQFPRFVRRRLGGPRMNVPFAYNVWRGEMRICRGEGCNIETLNDDTSYGDPNDYTMVSGIRTHELRIGDRPVYLLTLTFDTAKVSVSQLGLPLQITS